MGSASSTTAMLNRHDENGNSFLVYPAFDPSSNRRSTIVVPNASADYKNGRPTVRADEVYGCFTNTMTIKEGKEAHQSSEDAKKRLSVASPPGYLFRLVDRQKNRWYFYNDTKDYVMVVNGYFGPRTSMRVLKPARMWREMPSGLLLMEVVVEPLQTAGFLEGEVYDGFDLRFRAVPVQEAGNLVE